MHMLEGRKRAPERIDCVLVLGLGKSGRAAVEYCLGLLGTRIGCVAIAAGEENESSRAFAEAARERGALVAFGDDGPVALAAMRDAREEVSDRAPVFDVCIASPGISQFSYLYQSASRLSVEVISEVEFAWRESAASSRWVAVTGTNGKTTVTSLITHVLKAAGFHAMAVGNIGDTCIGALAAGGAEVYVAEMSSYQLASLRAFAPNAAVILNITPDHLRWHRSFEAYRDAKLKLLDNLASVPGSVVALDATNDVVREKVRELHAAEGHPRAIDYVPLGTADGIGGDMRTRCGSRNAAFLSDAGIVTVALHGEEHKLLGASDLLIKGAHNVSNALAAGVVAVSLGVDDDAIAQGLRTFAPLEHRIEPCGSVRGAVCYNDSKATNVDATLKALESFPEARPLVMLGGDDKGTDLGSLVAAAHAHARGVVCYGDAGKRFRQAFEDASVAAPADFSLLSAEHMEQAFDALVAIAREGDVILLSPACASFDEFSSFEERGRVFKALVATRGEA
ncbi:UDP-N-acetylmuramoyl-L-alanine--D-glutamate ligase [Adlercreutzia sp. ZJ138]|uniref:UDP-N-acetylmuramoyl-L-alanine--D-glutamate ligase n=1 Tax=Adlercreutzia sp. ZJ138 TaxID=2709405 RepID=UPI0013EDE8EC|nr:UDP-N-acetylmuramoyl-L-alanine--D-glutamate ligase [Adlercreutzia sp. ZJ138]